MPNNFQIGDFVLWKEAPGHFSKFARNQIIEVRGDRARLRFFATFTPLDQLEAIEATEAERKFCELYHLPVNSENEDF
jgi:hypothetical protein